MPYLEALGKGIEAGLRAISSHPDCQRCEARQQESEGVVVEIEEYEVQRYVGDLRVLGLSMEATPPGTYRLTRLPGDTHE